MIRFSFTLSLMILLGNGLLGQLMDYHPVYFHDILINNEELKNMNVYAVDSDNSKKRLVRTYTINRKNREIESEYFGSRFNEGNRTISQYSFDWKFIEAKGFDERDSLNYWERHIYKGRKLVKKTRFDSWVTERDGQQIEEVREREFIYRYADSLDLLEEEICYRGFDQDDIIYKRRYSYEFNEDASYNRKLQERYNEKLEDYELEGEYFYSRRKNRERVEYHPTRLSTNERLEEWFDKGRIVKAVCDSGRESRTTYEFEYYSSGELKTLTTTLKIGRKSSKQLLLEYEFN